MAEARLRRAASVAGPPAETSPSTQPGAVSAPTPSAAAFAQLRAQWPDFNKILPENAELSAAQVLAKAISAGYGVGPGHEGEPLDRTFYSALSGRLGPDALEAQAQPPSDLWEGMFGYPNPLGRMLFGGHSMLPQGYFDARRDFDRRKAYAEWLRNNAAAEIQGPDDAEGLSGRHDCGEVMETNEGVPGLDDQDPLADDDQDPATLEGAGSFRWCDQPTRATRSCRSPSSRRLMTWGTVRSNQAACAGVSIGATSMP